MPTARQNSPVRHHSTFVGLAMIATVAVIGVAGSDAMGAAGGSEAIDHGSVGLSASLQGGQREIAVPLWISDDAVLMPGFSFLSVSDGGTDIGLGMLLRVNGRPRGGRAIPYFGFRFAAFYFKPDVGTGYYGSSGDADSVWDFVVGPAFGGEYFLSEHLSLGVEGQVNIAISDKNSARFNNPDGTVINTATAARATLYF
jgi:hypothetical protein